MRIRWGECNDCIGFLSFVLHIARVDARSGGTLQIDCGYWLRVSNDLLSVERSVWSDSSIS